MAAMDKATEEALLTQLLAGYARRVAQASSGDAQQQTDLVAAREHFATVAGLLSGSHPMLGAARNIWQTAVMAIEEHGAALPARGGEAARLLPRLPGAAKGHSAKQDGLFSDYSSKSSAGAGAAGSPTSRASEHSPGEPASMTGAVVDSAAPAHLARHGEWLGPARALQADAAAKGTAVVSVGTSGATQPARGRHGAAPLPPAFGTSPFLRAVAAGYHAKGHAPQRSLPPRDRPLVPLAPSVTTLTVRKIPAPYTQEELLAEWPAAGVFDYLHFPYSEGLGRSVSIAFINFLTPELAACFYERWHGRRLARHPSARSLVVEASRVQGRNANLALVHGDARVLPVVSFGDEYLGGQRLLRMVELAKAGTCTARV